MAFPRRLAQRLTQELLGAAQQHAHVRACDAERCGDLVVIRVGVVSESERHSIPFRQLGDRRVDGGCALRAEHGAEPILARRLGGGGFLGFVAEQGAFRRAPTQ